MADDPDTAAELVSGGYEVRKSSVRRSAGSGVEVRVRAIRRRNWSTEDKLRIVRETLAPGAVAKVVAERHGLMGEIEHELRTGTRAEHHVTMREWLAVGPARA